MATWSIKVNQHGSLPPIIPMWRVRVSSLLSITSRSQWDVVMTPLLPTSSPTHRTPSHCVKFWVWQAVSSTSKRGRFKHLQRQAQTALRILQDEWWEKKAGDIETYAATNNSKMFSTVIKEVYSLWEDLGLGHPQSPHHQHLGGKPAGSPVWIPSKPQHHRHDLLCTPGAGEVHRTEYGPRCRLHRPDESLQDSQ